MRYADGQEDALEIRAHARSGYFWAAVAVILIAVTGFGRSYYFRPIFGRPSLPLLLHIHGLIMSLWCVLFFAQTWLVQARRVDLHRRLGLFGGALAILVVLLGAYVTVLAFEREAHQHVIGPFHYLLGINFVNLFLFAGLVTLGLLLRKRPEFHKRLMLLATVSMLAPAVARIALLYTHSGIAQLILFYSCVLTCVVVDTIRHQRLHPAMAWGALTIVLAFQGIYYGVQTHAWMNFVTRTFPA